MCLSLQQYSIIVFRHFCRNISQLKSSLSKSALWHAYIKIGEVELI